MTRYATEHGAYEIDSLPSQPQVAACHGFYIKPEFRGKGFGHVLKCHQLRKLQELSYDAAICTVLQDNEAQRRILEQAGWVLHRTFFSKRQNAFVEIWGVSL